MRRNWYTTTGLAVAIASLVLAGCGSADSEKGKEKVEKQKVEKVEKEKPEKAKKEKRGLSDSNKANASEFQSMAQVQYRR